MTSRAAAIVWAQWRASRNAYPRSGTVGKVIGTVAGFAWYAVWAVGAVAVADELRTAATVEKAAKFLVGGLFLALLYWQIIPVLMVSSGASLDMRRLRVYPIRHRDLFSMEVLLRLTTAGEVLLLLAGACAGIILNPALHAVYIVAFLPFVAMNLFLSAGMRDLLTRILNRRSLREIGVFFVVLLAATPQLILTRTGTGSIKDLAAKLPSFFWPWAVTTDLVTGRWTLVNWLAMTVWVALAYGFGRWQFERTLRFDAEAARASGDSRRGSGWVEGLFRLPGALLPDPLAALVEKELRSLTRSPRFRIAFLMGFSFGLLIWFPAVFAKGGADWIQVNYLAILFSYSLMLLSEVAIWNVLGFDRSAAQFYWLAPVRVWQVLAAKNIATGLFVALEMAVIAAVCVALRLNVTLISAWEAFLTCGILMVFLMAVGNLSSLYSPRPVDPNQTWKRGSGSRFQAVLLLVYPILLLPFVFAYWARWVWDANLVFYGVLGATALMAVIAYGFSMERAVRASRVRKELILSALHQGDGPVAA